MCKEKNDRFLWELTVAKWVARKIWFLGCYFYKSRSFKRRIAWPDRAILRGSAWPRKINWSKFSALYFPMCYDNVFGINRFVLNCRPQIRPKKSTFGHPRLKIRPQSSVPVPPSTGTNCAFCILSNGRQTREKSFPLLWNWSFSWIGLSHTNDNSCLKSDEHKTTCYLNTKEIVDC